MNIETLKPGHYEFRDGHHKLAQLDAVNGIMEVYRHLKHLYKGGRVFAIREEIAKSSDYQIMKIVLKTGKRKSDKIIYNIDRSYFLKNCRRYPITNKYGRKETLLAIDVESLTVESQNKFFKQENLKLEEASHA